MRHHPSIDASWCMKYIGVPVTLGITMYSILNYLTCRKRKAELRGKVVVITGASSGIGEALAHAFYEAKCKVVLAARRKPELERVKRDLKSKPMSGVPEPVVVELDLANYEHLDNFIQEVYNQCGNIDILINNGGISYRGAILETKLEVDKQVMNVNYFGSVALTKAVLPNMVKRKSGHIAFVSSVQGLIAIPDRAVYAATKHALQAFGDSLRAEMHQHNVNVTVISPGYIKTNISLNALTGSGSKHGIMDTSTAAGFTPEYTASKILDAIADKKNELVLSQFMPNLAIFFRHFAPNLYFWLMNKRATKTSVDSLPESTKQK